MPGKPKPTHKRQATFLRLWRKTRGFSQAAVGEAIGLDQANVGRMERGATPYDQDWLEMLAELYGCKPSDLLGRDPRQNSRLEAAIADLRAAPAEVQRQIIGYIDAKVSEESEKAERPSLPAATPTDSQGSPRKPLSDAVLRGHRALQIHQDHVAKSQGKLKGPPPARPGVRK